MGAMAGTLANIIRGSIVACAGVFTVNSDAISLGKDIALGKTTAAPAHAPKLPSAYEVSVLKRELEQARKELVQWKQEWPSVMESAAKRREELDRREARIQALEDRHRAMEEDARNYPMPEFLRAAGYDGTINVAVVGNSGVGKSLFINTVRGVKRGDATWAPVGVNETTVDPKMYQYPGEARTRLWDVAGAGSPKCPRDNYIQTIGLRYFDVVLVLSATRFTETEIKLLTELRTHSVPNFMVRTKLDTDIDNNESDYGRSADETKQGILEDLRGRGVEDPYLINARQLDAYDFPRLLRDTLATIRRSRGQRREEVPEAEAAAGPEPAQAPAEAAAAEAPKVKLASSPLSNESLVEDSPGMYVITHDNIKVSSHLALGADQAGGTAKRLSVGALANVLEVALLTEGQRVRARIENPPGWISLMNTTNGYRWAEKLAAPEEPDAA
mmetsp:Transcript_103252/g.291984  ORF Transcript_103252/g.291984 Transcript_103252/m.291984 type:complete len:444 (+) Transcript_103252:116-1447(+)